jgi:hypothetical protein
MPLELAPTWMLANAAGDLAAVEGVLQQARRKIGLHQEAAIRGHAFGRTGRASKSAAIPLQAVVDPLVRQIGAGHGHHLFAKRFELLGLLVALLLRGIGVFDHSAGAALLVHQAFGAGNLRVHDGNFAAVGQHRFVAGAFLGGDGAGGFLRRQQIGFSQKRGLLVAQNLDRHIESPFCFARHWASCCEMAGHKGRPLTTGIGDATAPLPGKHGSVQVALRSASLRLRAAAAWVSLEEAGATSSAGVSG